MQGPSPHHCGLPGPPLIGVWKQQAGLWKELVT